MGGRARRIGYLLILKANFIIFAFSSQKCRADADVALCRLGMTPPKR